MIFSSLPEKSLHRQHERSIVYSFVLVKQTMQRKLLITTKLHENRSEGITHSITLAFVYGENSYLVISEIRSQFQSYIPF